MFVKVFVGIVFDPKTLPKSTKKIVPRGFQEALERFQKSIQTKVIRFTQTAPYDHARGLPDSPPRVRGFEQLKTIIEQETAVAAIVVDVVADFVAVVVVVFVVVFVVVVVAVFVFVAVVANVVVDVVFLLLLFFFFYVARF